MRRATPANPAEVDASSVPLTWTVSNGVPTATQISGLPTACVSGVTGTVTVSSTPQPARTLPCVSRREPEYALRLKAGPMFADRERRIAVVPAGSLPPFWQRVVFLNSDVAWRRGTELVAMTAMGERESTTAIATRITVRPSAIADLTLVIGLASIGPVRGAVVA